MLMTLIMSIKMINGQGWGQLILRQILFYGGIWTDESFGWHGREKLGPEGEIGAFD